VLPIEEYLDLATIYFDDASGSAYYLPYYTSANAGSGQTNGES